MALFESEHLWYPHLNLCSEMAIDKEGCRLTGDIFPIKKDDDDRDDDDDDDDDNNGVSCFTNYYKMMII